MDPKDELEPPVVLHAQKISNSPIPPDRMFPPCVRLMSSAPGDDFPLWSFRACFYLKLAPASQCGQYLLSLLDDSAARQLMERKQSPGEYVDQFLGSLRDLVTNIYAAEDRIKIKVHPGLKAELIRHSPDNIRDAIQLARSHGAKSGSKPQLHALKISADRGARQLSPGNRNTRPGSRMNCRNLDKRPLPSLVDMGASCSLVGVREFLPGGRRSAVSTKLITVNGTPLQTTGTALLSVRIGQLRTHHQLYCAPVTWEAILENEFRKKYKNSTDITSG
ncbi:hypothetical protein X801_08832 [Opisthorchis viverrini]|uniref:Uncharacterized protein n=1 Tax=Opisthorchis viverrini TaxID=6198 RepID=A0A1S8WLM9_OPIVI|nr:hypothetical protein X801_08832 [Opisthorchis viverrini]